MPTDRKACLLIVGADEMKKEFSETEIHRIHCLVVPNLSEGLIERWKKREDSSGIKKFIICYPQEFGSDQPQYKIHSMLSGEMIEQDGKKFIPLSIPPLKRK